MDQNVIVFPLHRTKAWRENQEREKALLDELLVEPAQSLEDLNRELYRLVGLEYPGPP